MQSKHQAMTKVITILAASAVLLSTSAHAGGDSSNQIKCVSAASGTSLCGTMGSGVHLCVQPKPCAAEPQSKKRPERSRSWLFRGLFI